VVGGELLEVWVRSVKAGGSGTLPRDEGLESEHGQNDTDDTRCEPLGRFKSNYPNRLTTSATYTVSSDINECDLLNHHKEPEMRPFEIILLLTSRGPAFGRTRIMRYNFVRKRMPEAVTSCPRTSLCMLSFPAPIIQTPVVSFPPLQSHRHRFGPTVLTGCITRKELFSAFACSTASTLRLCPATSARRLINSVPTALCSLRSSYSILRASLRAHCSPASVSAPFVLACSVIRASVIISDVLRQCLLLHTCHAAVWRENLLRSLYFGNVLHQHLLHRVRVCQSCPPALRYVLVRASVCPPSASAPFFAVRCCLPSLSAPFLRAVALVPVSLSLRSLSFVAIHYQ